MKLEAAFFLTLIRSIKFTMIELMGGAYMYYVHLISFQTIFVQVFKFVVDS